ncbi:caspase-14-like [Trichosurus vulpecula]|uniref:caspase-14-like n=1 Tax=Trichosurus vulpecula TaxID=9337 RepID=UPI00186B4A87|nr:caspase-14-like [Trichosurus vulpecula]
METFKAGLVSTLDKLTQFDLEMKFKLLPRNHRKKLRITMMEIDSASTTSQLADLVLKCYGVSGTHKFLLWMFQRLGRVDLIDAWVLQKSMAEKQNAGSVDYVNQCQMLQSGEKVRVSITALKRQYENYGDKMEYYNMDQIRKAFVMCVKTGRPGAEQDRRRIINWLKECRFEYVLCIDPDKEELMKKLTEFRDGINGIKDDVSCCLLTLMAHGGKGFIKTVLDERVILSDIFEMFNNENCPGLQGKPKIFVIQACRGDRIDGGVVQTDSEEVELNESEKKRLPTSSDYYIVYSTQEDHVALRHPKRGAVMIQAIDEVFRQGGKKLHVVDFFTRVNNRVVNTDFYLGKNPVKVVLVMESTLTKAVYF